MRELRPLLPYMRRYRGVYTAGIVCVVSSNLLNTLGPRFVEQGIDALTGSNPVPAVRRAALLLLIVSLAGGVLRYLMRHLLNGVSRWVEYDLRNALFAHQLQLSAEFYDRNPTGDLMARSTNDLLNVRMVAGPALMYLVDTSTRALMIMPAMLAASPRLTVLALVPLLGLPPVMVFLGRRIHERSLAIQNQFGELTNFVHENVSGVRIVRAYRQETPETERFARLNQDYVERNLKLARAQGVFDPLLMLLGGMSSVVVLWVGGNQVLNGTVSRGAFVAFFVYLAMLVWPMIALGWAINLVQRGNASMSRLNELFRTRPTIADPPAPQSLAPAAARSIRFQDVWFEHPNAPERGWLLQQVSFEVPAGRSLAIVGATGAGKTMLVELLVRTYDPTRGRIEIDGVDLRRLSLAELRRTVGFVPQDTFLFSDTLRGNVLLGAPDDGRLERVAETSQLTAALADLPNGYDTMLGERGINLSGGQKQRTAIARALAPDPPIVVLDDALSAVDSATEARILHQLRSALVGKTSIIVSHRAAAVREAQQILVLDGGRIVERGRYEELLAAGGRFAELVRLQLLEEEIDAATTSGAGSPGSAPGAIPPAE